MNIRNIDNYQESFWDWSFLNDVFKYNIRVSDIDGVVERNGKFLYIETKRPNADIPTGQKKLHDAWVGQGSTIITIWGYENDPQYAEVRTPKTKDPIKIDNCTLDRIKKIVSDWFIWADSPN